MNKLSEFRRLQVADLTTFGHAGFFTKGRQPCPKLGSVLYRRNAGRIERLMARGHDRGTAEYLASFPDEDMGSDRGEPIGRSA